MSNVIYYMDAFNDLSNRINTYHDNDEDVPLKIASQLLLLEEWRINESLKNAETEAWVENEGGI